jgi:5-carboxymethyl-2-hydroxymuconate isomerase
MQVPYLSKKSIMDTYFFACTKEEIEFIKLPFRINSNKHVWKKQKVELLFESVTANFGV